MHLIGSGHLAPPRLVEALVEASPKQLDALPFGPLVLVMRAPEDDEAGGFMAALSQCALKEAPPRSQPPGWVATSEFPTVSSTQQEPSEADQIELLSELMAAPHCLVPLKGSDRAIVIGRAANSEIVLSDPSVSARHAQILMGEGGTRLVDLGSKNGTMINNRKVNEHEQPWLQSMDRVSFGRIQGFVCDPRALRGLLRQSLRVMF